MRRTTPARLALLAALVLAGCAGGGAPAAAPPASRGTASCTPVPAARLVPTGGVYLGASIDWGSQTLAGYARRLGRRPAVAVAFTGFPLGAQDGRHLDDAVAQVRADGGLLLLTLEPQHGLAAVTPAAATALARRLDAANRSGVPVVVRFGQEMNGSWYPWGQQPTAYVAAFRRVARAVHAGAPGSATMWAPSYGGGYPFLHGERRAVAGGAAALDTTSDGVLDTADDPYAPYWPGDDAADWVGMSLYHWGSTYPWGEDEVPEDGKLAAQLTGTYDGLGGDDRGVPDFYATYGVQHDKPVAIPETAAFYAPGRGGDDELAVKRAWWRQVLDPSLHQRFPRLAMVDWFEQDKTEPEVGGRVDWTATSTDAVRAAYRADLPAWALWAPDVPSCGRP